MLRLLGILVLFGLMCGVRCVWKVPNVPSNCPQRCSYVRSNYCGTKLCRTGAVFEQVTNCPYPQVCQGDLVAQAVVLPCTGICDSASESILLQCSTDSLCQVKQTRFCQNTASCSGEWTKWGDYGACSMTCGGIKTRTRGCFEKTNGTIPSGTVPSIYCAGSKGLQRETQTTACSPCTAAQDTTISSITTTTTAAVTSTTTKRERNGLDRSTLTCRNDCDYTFTNLDHNTLHGACDGGITSSTSCNTTERYLIFCNGTLKANAESCASPNTELHCLSYVPYEEWGEWQRAKDNPKVEVRYRHQWCTLPVAPISDGCRQEVRVEKQCREALPEEEELGSADWLTWLIALLLVFVFLFFIFVVCYLKRRCSKRKRKRKGKTNRATSDSLPPVEMKSFADEDTVFESETANQRPDTSRKKSLEAKAASNPHHLTVVQRIARVSEHLYESISARSTRIFSRSSVSTHPGDRAETGANPPGHMGDAEAGRRQGNEYIVDEEDPQKSIENKLLTKRFQNHPTRISVTITDPEGVQVGNSVYKPKLTVKTKDNEERNLQLKKRWSRVPTPRDDSKQKGFFKKDSNQNPHVPSVKYVTGDESNQQHNENTPEKPPPRRPKFAIKTFFKKLTGSPKQESHQYDAVPKEQAPSEGTEHLKPRIYLQSAGSALSFDEDNASMWSGSTYDDMFTDDEFSPPADESGPNLQYRTPRKTKNRRHKRKTRSTGNLTNDGHLGISQQGISSRSMEFPSPPSELLTPDPNAQPSATGTWSQPTRRDEGAMMNTLQIAEPTAVCYMDMAVLGDMDSTKRKNVKSWVNLGQAPLPVPEASGSKKNVTLKLDSPPTTSAEQEHYASPVKGSPRKIDDLDEKYMASISVPVVQISGNGNLPTDKHGYFQLGFPN